MVCTGMWQVGEYGMVLLGLKPCVVIDHGNWDEAHYGNQCFARKHYQHVVRRRACPEHHLILPRWTGVQVVVHLL